MVLRCYTMDVGKCGILVLRKNVEHLKISRNHDIVRIMLPVVAQC